MLSFKVIDVIGLGYKVIGVKDTSNVAFKIGLTRLQSKFTTIAQIHNDLLLRRKLKMLVKCKNYDFVQKKGDKFGNQNYNAIY